jgi:hypothetical protein
LVIIKKNNDIATYQEIYENCRRKDKDEDYNDYDDIHWYHRHKIHRWKEELVRKIKPLKSHIKIRERTNKCDGNTCAGYYFEPNNEKIMVIRNIDVNL